MIRGSVVWVEVLQEQKDNFMQITLFVSVKQNALSFENKDDVFWVWPIQDFGRLCTKELIGLVDFLKHFLKEPMKGKSETV